MYSYATCFQRGGLDEPVELFGSTASGGDVAERAIVQAQVSAQTEPYVQGHLSGRREVRGVGSYTGDRSEWEACLFASAGPLQAGHGRILTVTKNSAAH